MLFLLLLLFQILIQILGRFLAEQSRSSMENCLKQRLFSCLLKRDYDSVKSVQSGEWMNRLTSDTVIVANGLTQIVPSISGMLVRLIGALGAIVLMKPVFAAVMIPAGAVVLSLTHGCRGILKRLHKMMQEKDGSLRVFFQESLSSMLVIRAYGKEEQMENMAKQAMLEHKRARMKRSHFSNIFNAGFGTAMNGMYAIGVAFCGYGLLKGTMSYGTMTAILQLIGQVQSPFANLTGYLPQYYAMLASTERLMEAETFIEDKTEQLSEEQIQQFYEQEFVSLGMKNASFTY
ncbi:MAG: ABC transporter ATP-binding protein, partial [Lachnospiraceae bacterium]|nr:ABC transporter ATP-binding protein [Lachnospiraceae bacterium]